MIVISCLLSLKHKQQASSWARLLFSGWGKIGRDFIFLHGGPLRHTESPCVPEILDSSSAYTASPCHFLMPLHCHLLSVATQAEGKKDCVGHRWYYRRASSKTGLCSRQHSLLWRNTLFHSTFSLVTSLPFQWTLGHPTWLWGAAPQLHLRGYISSPSWFLPGPGKQDWARSSPDKSLMPARVGGGNNGLNEPVSSRGGAGWQEQLLTSALRDAKHRVVGFHSTRWVAGASILAAINCICDIGPGNFPAAGGSQLPDHLAAFNNII